MNQIVTGMHFAFPRFTGGWGDSQAFVRLDTHGAGFACMSEHFDVVIVLT
jgi:hypothetical protein